MYQFSAVDQFIRRHPTKVDIKKDDGYTALHLAALNNHLDVVTSFAELVSDTHVPMTLCVLYILFPKLH